METIFMDCPYFWHKFIVHAVNYIDLEDDLKDDLIVQLMYKSGVSLIFVTKL